MFCGFQSKQKQQSLVKQDICFLFRSCFQNFLNPKCSRCPNWEVLWFGDALFSTCWVITKKNLCFLTWPNQPNLVNQSNLALLNCTTKMRSCLQIVAFCEINIFCSFCARVVPKLNNSILILTMKWPCIFSRLLYLGYLARMACVPTTYEDEFKPILLYKQILRPKQNLTFFQL